MSIKLGCSLSPQVDANSTVNLKLDYNGLALIYKSKSELMEMKHDFQDNRLQKRTLEKNQALFKACNNRQKSLKTLLDLTAGWGHDSYLLASQGLQVTMLEINPVICLLLQNSLENSRNNQDETTRCLNLINISSLQYLQSRPEKADCIYLDPMFPIHKSSAKAKKPLQFLQSLTRNIDLEQAFELSLQQAGNRVVVKRPAHAEAFNNHQPDIVYQEKTIRFDVYLSKPES